MLFSVLFYFIFFREGVHHQGGARDVKARDRDKTETLTSRDRDETETLTFRDRDKTETLTSRDRDVGFTSRHETETRRL